MKELVFSRLFLPAVERYGQQECIIDDAYAATFDRHAARVLRLANSMRKDLGLERGDRFAVLGLNGHHYMELHNAGYLGAGVITPVNIRLSPTEIRRIVDDSGTAVLFADPRLAQLLEDVLRAEKGPFPRVVMMDGDYEDLVSAGAEVVPPEPDEEDLVALVYTGGTTGLPRGVMRSQRAEMLYVYHTAMSGGVACQRGWTFLHQAPMFHATALVSVASAPAFGVRSVVAPRFEPAACLDAVETYKVDETVLVPTMMQMLFEHPDFAAERLASLRRIGYGAMPMPPPLLGRLREVLPGVELAQGFGMTEAGALTMLQPEDHERSELLGSVGRAVPGVALSIQDADGAVLGAGVVGEVCAQGGNLLDGYWHDAAGTRDAFRDGWYRTGDVGYLDDEGYLFLVDRLKDMIVTGGENVYSVEVESVIARHPSVAQVAVIGAPHEKWGEVVHAVVVPKPGEDLSADDVVAYARQHLAAFKVPKSVEIRIDALPMSAAMKPLKRELREEPVSPA
ncbi:MAG TPA: AMP-binding protein [Acidimicrobiales bacterium]